MKDIPYSKAVEELEAIITEIENDETELDQMMEKVKRAAELIRYCRQKLLRTEDEVNNVLTELKELSEEE
ncbi:MAG: exodeoxyribonuclease VII small subunit [Marinilabiliales bacterium]|nr:MAG: exodeoxyribonuclease VII small subunit [Marinilabiliales bacterium]